MKLFADSFIIHLTIITLFLTFCTPPDGEMCAHAEVIAHQYYEIDNTLEPYTMIRIESSGDYYFIKGHISEPEEIICANHFTLRSDPRGSDTTLESNYILN
jgi:hypothetical protein